MDYAHWRQRVWRPAVEAAGVDGLTFHDLRRANATALVAEHVDIETAQSRLGHADPRATLGICARATGEGDRKAAEAVAERLIAPPPVRQAECHESAMETGSRRPRPF